MPLEYSPFSAASRADPFPVYRRLRDEAPVHWTDEPGAWVVSRYADVVQVLKRPELFSSDAMSTVLMGVSPTALLDPASDPDAVRSMLAFAQAMPFDMGELGTSRNLIAADPPRHDAMRAIVNRGFTPRRIAAWEPRVRELVDECMQRLRRGEEFDVIRDLSVPVPTVVIAELLGVEPGRRDDFKRWSDAIISGTSGSRRGRDLMESGVVGAVAEFAEYFVEVAERRRREPRDDLASVLLSAQGSEDGLSPSELVLFALLLLVAGNETTTNLIGTAVNLLLDHPAELAKVNADLRLVPALVEETLRYEGPVQLLFRRVTRDVEVGGTRIAAHQVVVPLLGSANRDPRHWGDDAEEFRVARDPQGHLGFGFGVHFCLGASLARLEARCVLEALVPELPRRVRRHTRIEYVDSTLMRGPRALELLPAA
jgi:cytochrome P450